MICMEDTLDRFVAVAHGIVWCTLATVDRHDRPRSRLVHPVWERAGDRLVGWLGTRPTPLKRAHLAHSPFVSCSYWDPRHDVAVAECAATWVLDAEGRRAGWERLASAPAPAGYDPATIWPDGPEADDFAILRLDPWRLRVATAAQLATGEPAAVWHAAGSAAAASKARTCPSTSRSPAPIQTPA
jgi:hypothetical protein